MHPRCYLSEVAKKSPGSSGSAYPITRQWQEDVRARMLELDWSQYDLAKAVGCTQPAIAWVLRPEAKHSALVPKIHKALGLAKPATPTVSAVDPERAELYEMLEKLSEDEISHIIATVKLLTRTKKPE